MRLSLMDELGQESHCEFVGRLDRSIKRDYERKRPRLGVAARLRAGTGLHGSAPELLLTERETRVREHRTQTEIIDRANRF
jgi:hypothetical protein